MPRLLDRRSLAAIAVAALVMIALVVITHRTVGWRQVLDRASTLPAQAWLAFGVLMSASYLARLVRFWALVKPLRAGIAFGAAAPVFLVHNALVTFLPARMGEVAMPALAHRWAGVHWSGVVGLLAWWRVVDLAIICMVALALLGTGTRLFVPLLALAAAACMAPVLVFAFRARIIALLQRWSDRSPKARLAALARRVVEGVPRSWRAVVLDIALAWLAWGAKLVSIAVVLGAAIAPTPMHDSRDVSWPVILTATIAADVAGSLPVPSFGGTGAYEAAAVAVLSARGLSPAAALSATLVAHGVLLAGVLASGVIGLVLQASRSLRQDSGGNQQG